MTGTVQKPTPTLVKHKASGALEIALTNASGGRLEAGHAVRISADNSVAKATATTYPIGVVTVGGDDGQLVTVGTHLCMVQRAVAKGGTLSAGALVVTNGNVDANSQLPEYVAAVATNYANAIVLKGGAVDTEIELGILHTPILIA